MFFRQIFSTKDAKNLYREVVFLRMYAELIHQSYTRIFPNNIYMKVMFKSIL